MRVWANLRVRETLSLWWRRWSWCLRWRLWWPAMVSSSSLALYYGTMASSSLLSSSSSSSSSLCRNLFVWVAKYLGVNHSEGGFTPSMLLGEILPSEKKQRIEESSSPPNSVIGGNLPNPLFTRRPFFRGKKSTKLESRVGRCASVDSDARLSKL